jgi:uncharacterized protein YdbL (DUF1318 family)
MRRLSRVVGLAVAVLIVGCVPVTVNINFTQDRLNKAADQIEDMVRSPENPKPDTPAKPQAPSSSLDRWLAAFQPREAAAQGTVVQVSPAPRVDSPEIEKAVDSRRARRPQLRELKSRGCIGESNQGLVEARPGQGCGAEVAGLLTAENADRQAIMMDFMRHNNIPANDVARVRAAFAKSHRERAQAGDWIQQDGGEWAKK